MDTHDGLGWGSLSLGGVPAAVAAWVSCKTGSSCGCGGALGLHRSPQSAVSYVRVAQLLLALNLCSCLLCFWDKILDTHKLRKERFILLHSL